MHVCSVPVARYDTGTPHSFTLEVPLDPVTLLGDEIQETRRNYTGMIPLRSHTIIQKYKITVPLFVPIYVTCRRDDKEMNH